MRSPATLTLVYPAPRPWAFQRSFGPLLDHSRSRPASGECPSRCGPRNCGQSSDAAIASNDDRTTRMAAMDAGSFFMVVSLGAEGDAENHFLLFSGYQPGQYGVIVRGQNSPLQTVVHPGK